MLAEYIHNLDPVIFSVTDSIKLRWYGFAYLLAFVAGYYLLKKLGDKKLWVLPGNQAGDFIAVGAFFGVFLGGRIGNVLVYQMDEFLADPLMIFKVWEGGMASHGGIAGLMIFTFFYARHKKVSWTGLGDALCVVAPIGIMFGRLANFINGELYGRIAQGYGWAMKFPNALWDPELKGHEFDKRGEAMRVAKELDPSMVDRLNNRAEGVHESEILNATIRDNESVRDAMGQFLEPRYPSQLFQAAGEGLALFLILFIVRLRFRNLYNGVLTGMFFILYAVFRITMENFREPETENINLLGATVTMGQFLSFFMIIIGAGFIAWAMKAKQRLVPG